MPRGHYQRRPLDDRFWDKVAGGEDVNLCWEWKAARDKDGYPVFHDLNNRSWRAHRWAYTRFVGPIPAGLTIDHHCNNPACVNPAHLETATATENAMRGNGIMAKYARRNRCKHGHLLSGENLGTTLRWGKTYRRCLECYRNNYRRSNNRRQRSHHALLG